MHNDLTPLPPGGTIGILGGGQLARMLALAAAKLGLKAHIYCDKAGSPAFEVAHAHTLGAYSDTTRLEAFARTCDVITYEFENVPLQAARALEALAPLRPSARSLEFAQDRLLEKQFILGCGLPLAEFHPVDGPQDAVVAARALQAGLPATHPYAILKTRRLGYDGKGQAKIADPSQAHAAWAQLGGTPSVIERLVPFQAELSVLIARSLSGTIAAYDIPRNDHVHGILATSRVPSGLPQAIEARARDMATTLALALDYVGVLGVELFYLGENAPTPLLINEFAPRVHNSGHWTMDACLVSQFENHIRAVVGWPLGSTARHSDAVMTNLIGTDVEDWARLIAKPDASLYLYGKNEIQAGRKMGHMTSIEAPFTPKAFAPETPRK